MCKCKHSVRIAYILNVHVISYKMHYRMVSDSYLKGLYNLSIFIAEHEKDSNTVFAIKRAWKTKRVQI